MNATDLENLSDRDLLKLLKKQVPDRYGDAMLDAPYKSQVGTLDTLKSVFPMTYLTSRTYLQASVVQWKL